MSALTQTILGGLLLAACAIGGYYGGHLFISGIKNLSKQPEGTKTPEKPNVLQKLPLFDFIVKEQAQDPERKYVDEILSITNKGEAPAENVTIIKRPLPDNKQKVAVSGQQKRINEAFTKKLLVVGINDPPHFLFKERRYAGKDVRITIMFRKSNHLFEFIYEGKLSKLRLVKRSYSDKGKRIIF